MKRLFLLLVTVTLIVSSCEDMNVTKRQYRLRNPKNGAISIEQLNDKYRLGDTVCSDSSHISVIVDTL